ARRAETSERRASRSPAPPSSRLIGGSTALASRGLPRRGTGASSLFREDLYQLRRRLWDVDRAPLPIRDRDRMHTDELREFLLKQAESLSVFSNLPSGHEDDLASY